MHFDNITLVKLQSLTSHSTTVFCIQYCQIWISRNIKRIILHMIIEVEELTGSRTVGNMSFLPSTWICTPLFFFGLPILLLERPYPVLIQNLYPHCDVTARMVIYTSRGEEIGISLKTACCGRGRACWYQVVLICHVECFVLHHEFWQYYYYVIQEAVQVHGSPSASY